MHRYTVVMSKKCMVLIVFLLGVAVSIVFSQKEALQRLAEDRA